MSVVARHSRRVVAGAALLLALAAGVHAAGRSWAIELGIAQASRTAAAGGTARFTVEVDRRGGFSRRVAIYVRGLPRGARAVWRLPSGATLPRAYSRGPTVLVPARRRTVVLAVQIPGDADPGSFRPLIHAYGWRVRHTRRVRLEIRPGVVVSPAPAPGFRITAREAGRSVLQGDEGAWELAVDRSGGFSGPVAMTVDGLPPGATARWSENPVAGARVTMSVETARSTPTGSYELVVSGSAGGVTERALATLAVAETKPFGIAGNAASPLRPGGTSVLDLQLTNPYDFDLRVERLDVALAEATSAPGCSARANFAVAGLAPDRLPLRLPPGTTRLGDLVPAAALPRLEMLETGADQDACKGAELRLAYSGVAGK